MTGSSPEFYDTGTNFFQYRYQYFFPGPNFSAASIFFGTNFFRYYPKSGKFPGILWYRYRYFFSGTGMSHSDLNPVVSRALYQ